MSATDINKSLKELIGEIVKRADYRQKCTKCRALSGSFHFIEKMQQLGQEYEVETKWQALC